jgi:UPF0716 family protein affecting phage T7 exclusion
MRKVGCLGILLLIGLFSVELWLYLVVAQHLNDYLVPILVMIAMGIIGFKVARHHFARIAANMLSGKAGRHLVGAAGGMLMVFPGLGSDALGVLLLLPGINHLLGRFGDVVMMSMARQGLQRMFGGKPGMMPGFPLPGRPDDRAAFPRGRKTYDTKAEKDEPPHG